MKRLVERITSLEGSVEQLVKRLTALKEENKILSEQNERLIDKLNQLNRGGSQDSTIAIGEVERNTNSESEINVEELRLELDRCINEVENCLKML